MQFICSHIEVFQLQLEKHITISCIFILRRFYIHELYEHLYEQLYEHELYEMLYIFLSPSSKHELKFLSV